MRLSYFYFRMNTCFLYELCHLKIIMFQFTLQIHVRMLVFRPIHAKSNSVKLQNVLDKARHF